ncbi:MAG: site-specific DNA-methyltransferase [Acidobacteria bacterium]|nr:MAG: site-specific DNA-methyltransferase [Acidobacteriota bacterium]
MAEPVIIRSRNSVLSFYGEDCVEGMKRRLEPGSVDVVVTSPPYNLGTAYGKYRDDLPRQEYLEWTRRWSRVVRNLISDEGSFFLNVGGKPTDPWIPFDVARAVAESFVLQNTVHWIKSIAIDRESMGKTSDRGSDVVVGHYKPINSRCFLNDCHEYVFHFTPSGSTSLDRLAVGVPYQDKSNVSRWKAASGGLRCRGNTWYLPYDTIQHRSNDRPHPASFPVGLPERCLRLHGLERCRLALDPFSGIGSTAVACLRLQVDFAGFEIDEEYNRVALTRLEKARHPHDVWELPFPT